MPKNITDSRKFKKDIKITDENIPDREVTDLVISELTKRVPVRNSSLLTKAEKEFPGITKEYLDVVNEYNRIGEIKTLNDCIREGSKSVRGREETGFVFKNTFKASEIVPDEFHSNDILKLEKLNPYDLLVKCAYSGIKLQKFIYYTHDSDRHLLNRILKFDKFKNIKIDKNLINVLMFTDNKLFKRQLFYPAFFIDADFKFDNRFIVKGMLVFECYSRNGEIDGKRVVEVKFNEDKPANDVRIHFGLIDKKKNDVTEFGISFNDIKDNMWESYALLSEYENERKEIGDLISNVARIVCNVIDLIEGNKDELETRLIIPSVSQMVKRLKKGKSPITTTVIIKPKKELLAYTEAFEREHRKMRYSHKFVVRGFWRHLGSERYKNMQGKKIWIKPFLKGHGILVKKDALFTDGKK